MYSRKGLVSIVICSLNREESLKSLLESIKMQNYTNFEIIVIDREAPLIECKNEGIIKASGEYIMFIDDDVELEWDWIDVALKIMKKFKVGGVSGVSKEDNQDNRDVLKFKRLRGIYDYFFMGGNVRKPNNIIYGAVDYLEPSCYLTRREFLEDLFDNYEGVAEWSDVDFCYTVRDKGYTLINHPYLISYHFPQQDYTYNKRLQDIWHRYRNFCKFSKKHLKPSIRLFGYKLIMLIYFFMKERRWI